MNFFIILLVLGGTYLYHWYINLPKPQYVNLTVNEIIKTEIKVNPEINPLIVKFDSSSAKIDLVGKTVLEGITVSPKIDGTWTWQDDRTLLFKPVQDWAVGQTYNVDVSRNIFAKNILLEKYKFTFVTPKILGSLIESKFYEDPTDPKVKQAVGSFKFTHRIDKSDFEKRVDVSIREINETNFDKKLDFKVLYNDDSNEAYIRSQSLQIPEREAEVRIQLKKDIHSNTGGSGTETEYETLVKIPSIDSYFKIEKVEERIVTNPKTYLAERFIIVSTSAAVKADELTKAIEVSLLPVKPEEAPTEDEYYEGEEYNNNPHCWASAGEVPQEFLSKAVKLETKNESNEEDMTLHSFKFKAEPSRCLLVKIKAGTKSFSGFQLNQDRFFTVSTSEFNKEVKILHEGALLSASGSKKLSVMGRNLTGLRFTIYRILPNAINHLITQTATYINLQSPRFDNYNFGPENISEVFTQDMPLASTEAGLPQYTNFDFNNFIKQGETNGLFILKVQGWNPANEAYEPGEDSRLVLVSDLGILVKEGNSKEKSVYALSFSNKTGVNNADVSVIGKNGLSVFDTKTDQFGIAKIPTLDDFKFDKEPTAILVNNGQDLSFIPWNRGDRRLDLSGFETGGIYTDSSAQSLVAYLFSDRGIYRPGESAKFGIILKNKSWTGFTDLPLELTVTNPKGTVVKREKIKLGDPGFYDYEYKVSEEAILGAYSLEVNLIAEEGKRKIVLGTTPFKVEEFLPDRLKLQTKFSEENKAGWLKPYELTAKVKLDNLFGTAAAGNKVKASLKLYPSLPNFASYPGFNFYDSLKTKNSFDEDLGEKFTDEKGETTFDLNLSKYNQGSFFLRVITEGFEKDGGRSVLNNISAIVSPLDYLVGWKADSELGYLKLKTQHKLELIALNQNLEKMAVQNLKIERIKTEYSSVLTKQPNGDLAYKSVSKRISKGIVPLNITTDNNVIDVDTTEAGQFEYRISNEQGMELNSIQYFVGGEGNTSRELERNAELKVKLDKKDYANGEEIELNIQAPYTGVGLITIEKDNIYESKWFTAETTSSIQKITVPDNLEGNAYVNVSFIRSLDSEEIFMSPLSYGVVPFSVSRQKRTAELKLASPEKILPGTKLEIELSSNMPVEVVVFAVDEGIHQVARYKQPDPLSHFYRKQALEVSTMQIVDLLLPEFDIANKLSAPGGDEDALLGKFRNPFKRKTQPPVVYWSGKRTINGTEKFSFDVPDYYNGNIKIYAVAVSSDKIGIAASQTLVQNDLVLQPTAPLVATPEDEFDVSTTVANTTKKEEDVTVSVSTDEKLKIISKPEQLIKLLPGEEKLVSFKVKALDQLGSAGIKFNAKSGTQAASYTLDLSVRPASPKTSFVDSGFIKTSEKEKIINLTDNLYSQLKEQEISVSLSPLAWTWGLTKFLENYPYGCTEQVISQAFPRLALAGMYDDKDSAKFIEQVFALLAARQNQDGSLSLWKDIPYDETALIPNIHVARFALEAGESGFDTPEIFETELRNFVKQVATRNDLDAQTLVARSYATYVLARSNIVVGNYLEALKNDLPKAKLALRAESLVKLFMAAAYKIQKQDAEADKIVKTLETEIKDSYSDSNYYTTQLAYFGFYLDLVSRHFPELAKNLSDKIIANLGEVQKSYTTFSASEFILAVSKYTEVIGSQQQKAKVEFSNDGKTYTPVELENKPINKLSIQDGVRFVKISNPENSGIFYQVSEIGFPKLAGLKDVSQGYEIRREYLDAKGNQIDNFAQGEDVYVHLLVRTLPGTEGEQSAITDLLPAGLEITGGSNDLGLEVGKIRSTFYPIFKEAREDRVILIGSVGNDISEYVYKAKASSTGKFVSPLAQVESMYDLKAKACIAPGKLEVRE